jgi:2-keto-3-deoxy-L-rhamnonate aldolase RhmA
VHRVHPFKEERMDHPKVSNDAVITMAMIEMAQALKNLDNILSTSGLDAIAGAQHVLQPMREGRR